MPRARLWIVLLPAVAGCNTSPQTAPVASVTQPRFCVAPASPLPRPTWRVELPDARPIGIAGTWVIAVSRHGVVGLDVKSGASKALLVGSAWDAVNRSVVATAGGLIIQYQLPGYFGWDPRTGDRPIVFDVPEHGRFVGAVSDGTIAVLAAEVNDMTCGIELLGFEVGEGRQQWRRRMQTDDCYGAFDIGLAAANGQLYINTVRWAVALDLRDGAEIWRTLKSPTWPWWYLKPVAAKADRVVFGIEGNRIVVHHGATGQRLHTIPVTDFAISHLVLGDDAVYIGVDTGTEPPKTAVAALSIEDGRELWRHEFASHIEQLRPGGELLYLHTDDGLIRALAPPDGTISWKFGAQSMLVDVHGDEPVVIVNDGPRGIQAFSGLGASRPTVELLFEGTIRVVRVLSPLNTPPITAFSVTVGDTVVRPDAAGHYVARLAMHGGAVNITVRHCRNETTVVVPLDDAKAVYRTDIGVAPDCHLD
ncbi:MAG: PQQ-binding-like beta-propeller repeat protein [Myxococcota bacterium]